MISFPHQSWTSSEGRVTHNVWFVTFVYWWCSIETKKKKNILIEILNLCVALVKCPLSFDQLMLLFPSLLCLSGNSLSLVLHTFLPNSEYTDATPLLVDCAPFTFSLIKYLINSWLWLTCSEPNIVENLPCLHFLEHGYLSHYKRQQHFIWKIHSSLVSIC